MEDNSIKKAAILKKSDSGLLPKLTAAYKTTKFNKNMILWFFIIIYL